MGELKNGYLIVGNYVNDWYEKNKAHFWTGVSMAGTAVTAVVSATDTARIFRKCRKEHGCDPKDLPMKERLKLYAANYIPTVVCAGSSMYGAKKADLENGKIIAERTGLYLATRKSYDLLKKNLKEVVGEKKAAQVQEKTAEDLTKQAMEPQGVIQQPILSIDMFENAPRSGNGTLYPFIDGYSNLPLWSNIDYIDLTVMGLNQDMKEQAPRGDEFDYYDRKVGVPYSNWLRRMNFSKKIWDTPERKDHGWNKGFDKDGEDDDEIAYVRTPIELKPGFVVTRIDWVTEPTDMKLGRILKSNVI